MYFCFSLGAIFTVFILYVNCASVDDYNEINRIYVPSAPLNLSVKLVTGSEVQLTWANPASYFTLPAPDTSTPALEGGDGDARRIQRSTNDTQTLKPDLSNEASVSRDEKMKERDGASEREGQGSKVMDNDENLQVFPIGDTPAVTELPRVPGSDGKDPMERAWLDSDLNDNTPGPVNYLLYVEEGTVHAGIRRDGAWRRDARFNGDESSARVVRLEYADGRQGRKGVKYTLRGLKPVTVYKVWARAYFIPSQPGPPSEPLVLLTDVLPPGAPTILNLTCQQPPGTLFVQWRMPEHYVHSLDFYFLSLRRVGSAAHHRRPALPPRMPIPTSADHYETFLTLTVEVWNVTTYEVSVLAATKSLITEGLLFNGSETPAQQVSMSEWGECVSRPLALAPGAAPAAPSPSGPALAAAAAALLVLLALALLLYWRSRVTKCISAAYSYLEEGVGSGSGGGPDGMVTVKTYKKPASASPAPHCPLPSPMGPRLCDVLRPPVRAEEFAAHVAALHADGDIGFSKEYEVVVGRSAALAHTSQHSHRPENRHKNRYLNITAYDHSRVCLLPSSGDGSDTECGDYVNANFIDGVVGRVDVALRDTIRTQRAARAERRRRREGEREKEATLRRSGGKGCGVVGDAGGDNHVMCEVSSIETAFLNIEFSGIVESEEQHCEAEALRRLAARDEDDLDDIYVDIDGVPTQVRLEWLLRKCRYIATQGPTPATTPAFWRMLWDHRVAVLIMITNLVERGRRKCDMYWPREGTERYGVLEVSTLREEVRATCTERIFQLRHTKLEGAEACREVVQYHFTVWPDHGTPEHPRAVLRLVRRAATAPGTVLVHCSAGVGRTGTYIVLDAMLNHLRLTGTINVFGFLCHVRAQRNFLVQTEEQYIFIHDALLEALRSGDTEVPLVDMQAYLHKLLEPLEDEDVRNQRETEPYSVDSYIKQALSDNDEKSESITLSSSESVPTVQTEKEPSSKILNVDSNRHDNVHRLSLMRTYPEDRILQENKRNSMPETRNTRTESLHGSRVEFIPDGANLLENGDSRSEDSESRNSESMMVNGCKDGAKVADHHMNGLIQPDRDRRRSVEDKSEECGASESDKYNTKDTVSEGCETAPMNGRSSNYEQAMNMYNTMSNQEKEECKRMNRAENYELLERMWSLSSHPRHVQPAVPATPPKNLLEKQFQLVQECVARPSIAAQAPHNAEKNRPGGALPADAARVLLVPRPAVEGSEYVNASWVAGRRRLREFALAQHPPRRAAADLPRLLWDHAAQILLVLSPADDPECVRFWPNKDEPEMISGNFRLTFLSEERFVARRRSVQPPAPAAQPNVTPPLNTFYHRQPSVEHHDHERLIPSTTAEEAPDRNQLRIENLVRNDLDDKKDSEVKKSKLSSRKSIANGDLFASLVEKRNGPKSPSKISLKNFKLSSPIMRSPTKFMFPDFGTKKVDSGNVENVEAEKVEEDDDSKWFSLCYEWSQEEVNDEASIDEVLVVRVTHVTLGAGAEYELRVRVLECSGWGLTARHASTARSMSELIAPLGRLFALAEFVGALQMQFKNSPVVVVDKYGGSDAALFCGVCEATHEAAAAAARGGSAARATWDAYAHVAAAAARRAPGAMPAAHLWGSRPALLLLLYAAAAAYGSMLAEYGNSPQDDMQRISSISS